MPTRRSRPLLRVAALTAGALLSGCGSATGGPEDPVPLPGNPKGTHFDDGATKPTEPHAPPPLPIAGNPKGSHFDHAATAGGRIVGGTITLADGVEAKGQAVFVSVRAKDAPGPPLAAKKLPLGPFPLAFELTEADRPMAQGPIPDAFEVKVTLDGDGDPMSKDPADPTVTVTGAKGATDLAVVVGAAPSK